jgi:hypothetical protein
MTRLHRFVALCAITWLTVGCANFDNESTSRPRAVSPPSQAAPASPFSVADEIGRLRVALAREVPEQTPDSQRDDQGWTARATAMIARSNIVIDHPQLVVVVDRSPSVQRMVVMAARPDARWEVIGGTKVSTGQAGRRRYFITPTGVFVHGAAILDYRAEGTFNENHIRGLGLKGMRVWDFGWHPAERGWTRDGTTVDIRLLMHATDPDTLESRLGRPASMGWVRIPAKMNRFLDLHGVLDADHERAAATDARFRAALRPDRTPTPLAGNMLIVVDSSVTR